MVTFKGKYGQIITAEIEKINFKNVKAREVSPVAGRRWNVAASFLKAVPATN